MSNPFQENTPFSQEKLEAITKNRVRMSVCLIMIMEHRIVPLDSLAKYTGFTFSEINKSCRELVRLQLVDVKPTEALPVFEIIDVDEARDFIKLLEDNLYL